MPNKIPVFFHKSQLDFNPKYEWAFGEKLKHPETTKRVENIFRMLKKNKDLIEFHEPRKIALKAIRDTHSYQLITLYNAAMRLDPGVSFHPNVFPQKKRAKPDPTDLNHAGHYCFDSGTPLTRHTWEAAAWAATTAYDAAKYILDGKSSLAYALSRPPGHHASRDYFGGYCYFNNAAIAAKLLRKSGNVAIVDIDFHHGNGTQDIFYNDDRVLTISLHAAPRDWYPYFWGYQSELGSGKGLGFNQNIILKNSTTVKTYLKMLKEVAFPTIKKFDPKYLIIGAGFDTYKLDHMGSFQIDTPDYQKIAKAFKSLNLPTLIVQEGGYYAPHLGQNLVSFLKGFI